jgi:hypothetical protein
MSPKLHNVLFLLKPREAAMAGTANRKTRNAARVRTSSPRARSTIIATQAAKVGRRRYKASKKNENLNKIYNSLGRLGILSNINWYKNNLNSYIKLYGNFRNHSIPPAEQARLERKMKKMKDTLVNHMRRKIKNSEEYWNNPSSQGTTPNYNEYRWR